MKRRIRASDVAQSCKQTWNQGWTDKTCDVQLGGLRGGVADQTQHARSSDGLGGYLGPDTGMQSERAETEGQETHRGRRHKTARWEERWVKRCFKSQLQAGGITMPFINAKFADKSHLRPFEGRQSIPFLLG